MLLKGVCMDNIQLRRVTVVKIGMLICNLSR